MRNLKIITVIVLNLIITLKSLGQFNPNDVYVHRTDLDKSYEENFYENQKRIQSLVGLTAEETAKNMDDYLSSINDENNSGKITAFDAGPSGANLERFLNSPCYETIGFSPSTDRNDLEEQYKLCEANKNKSFYYKVGYIVLFILVTLMSFILGLRPSFNIRKSSYRMHSYSKSNPLNTNERVHNYGTMIKNDNTANYQKTAMGNWLNEKLTSNQKYFLFAFIVLVGIPILLLVLKLSLL
jgi:hypothetical protein